MQYFICKEANSLPVLELASAESLNIKPDEKIREWKSILKNTQEEIPVLIGGGSNGKPIIFDLTRAPHVLIAGNDKQVQSIKMTIIKSFILNEPKAIVIDFFKRENPYTGLNEFLEDVSNELGFLVLEMKSRFRLLSDSRCYTLKDYNKNHGEDTLSFIVVFLNWPNKVSTGDNIYRSFYERIKRLVCKSRPVGIHLIIVSDTPYSVPSPISSNLLTQIIFNQKEFDYPYFVRLHQ